MKVKGDLWKVVTTTGDECYVIAVSAAAAAKAVRVDKMYNERVRSVEWVADNDHLTVVG